MNLIRKSLSLLLLLPIIIFLLVAIDYLKVGDLTMTIVVMVLALILVLIGYKLWPESTNRPAIETISINRLPVSNFKTKYSKVVGLNFEDRYEALEKLVKEIKSNIDRDELYDGLRTKKQLIEYYEDILGDETVWELTEVYFDKCELKHDVLNEFDKYAIEVYVGNDELIKIGYLPKEDAEPVFRLIQGGSITLVNAKITGGNLKTIVQDDWDETKYEIVQDFKPYGIAIEIEYKK